MKAELVVTPSEIVAMVDPIFAQQDTASARIRMAGIVENAVTIEVVSIEAKHVVLRIRIGDEHDREYRLTKRERFVGHMLLKSESLGAER